MKHEVQVLLTPSQHAELAPLHKAARAANLEGKPGIIIAQCKSDGRLAAAFIPYETALKIRELVGTKELVMV
jgi:hypothetical protein